MKKQYFIKRKITEFESSTNLVSIVIPTYNRAHTLQRAVDSVLIQTYHNSEIVLVDDGSTDGTKELIENQYKNVRYFYIPHSGVSKARNKGIEKAKGSWISFLDSDDYWLPEKLSSQLSFLKMNPEYKICHADEIWIKNGKRINQGKKHHKFTGWFFSPSLHMCLISPSSVIIHTSVFDEIGVFDEDFKYGEDYELWLRITARYPVGYIDKKLVVKTGGHEDQLSQKIDGIEKYRINALEKLILTCKIREEFLAAAIKEYRRKCDIYISGCRKRGKIDEIKNIQSKMANINVRQKILN